MVQIAGVDALLGATLAGYRIESIIGRGGMGVVYLAADAQLERNVALKVLAPELSGDARFRARFLRESHLAAALEHPSIVPVHAAGEADGVLYIVMRFVDGVDLGQLIDRDGPLPAERALAIVRQVADALDAAHERGLVHRDVKPANVLLDQHDRAYLADFGLGKRVEGTSRITASGQMLGTVDYTAPEQIRGESVGPEADVYALGCLLYKCLTGRAPYPRESDLAVLWAHMYDDPPRLSARRADLPTSLDDVLARALAKETATRFASCARLVVATHDAIAGVPAPAAPAGLPEVRKTVTVLFAALGPGRGADQDPEATHGAVARCLEAAEAVLVRHGGAVERVAGEELVAVFGIPVVREDDAVRAAQAAAELGERLAEVDARFAARIGIESGEVLAPQDAASPGLVTGAPLRAAAQLERAAEAGEVILGPRARDLAGERVVVERLEADGLHDGGAWKLVGLAPRPVVPQHPVAAPLVGRERELAALRAAFEETCAARTCRIAAVLGPAGIGKTRLATAFASAVDGDAGVLAGRCLSYGEGITFWPLAEALRPLVGDDTRGGFERLLDGEADAELVSARVAAAIGLVQADEAEETFWAFRRLLETLARRRPLVLMLEDVQWAEATLLELLAYLTRAVRDAPVLIVCLARPELLDRTLPWTSPAATIVLEPLEARHATSLIERLSAASGGVPAALASRIAQTAEGNPLFIEQLLAMALEDPGGSRETTLPPAIRALLSARLERLGPEERQVVACASIEGLVFHLGPLADLCHDIEPSALGRHLIALTRKDFVQSDHSMIAGDEAMRFRHGLIREAAYQSLPKEQRAVLHERFASFLERIDGDRMIDEEEFVGYHFEQAARYGAELAEDGAAPVGLAIRAASRLGAAGRRALARGDLPAGINLLERASSLRPEDPALLAELGTAFTESGRLEDAEAVLEDSLRFARAGGDRLLEGHALVHRLALGLEVDTDRVVDEVPRVAGGLAELFEREGDSLGLCRLLRLQGLVAWWDCRAGAASATWELGVVHARRAEASREVVDLLEWLASAACTGPTPVSEAIRRCEEIRAELHGFPRAEAWVLRPLAALHAMTGDFAHAHELLERSLAVTDELGLRVNEAVPSYEVFVDMLEGDPARAQQRARRAYEQLTATGEQAFLAEAAVLLAVALEAQGDDAEAVRFAQVAASRAGRADPNVQVAARSVQAKILARAGRSAEAEALAREAVQLAEPSDFVNLQADAWAALAEVLRLGGRSGAAADALQMALALRERKGNLVGARQTSAGLATMARAGDSRRGSRER